MKGELNRELKNVHNEMITLFVKKNNIETRVDIPAGHSMIVDEYETPTMRVFKKKNLITVEPSQLFQSGSFGWLSDSESPISDAKDSVDASKTMDSSIDPDNDEVMDQFHTTETHEVIDVDLKDFKEKLMKDLTESENVSRLDVVENEVEQYIEEGYIKGAWTDEDIAYLKKNYPTKGRKHCSTHLNRNESSVQKKINSLGLKKRKKKK